MSIRPKTRSVWKGCCLNAAVENRSVLRQAFVDSLPVLMGYSTMGFVAGVLLAAKGDVCLAPLWAFLTGALWVTGTMNFAFVPLVAAREPILSLVVLTLMVNFRYAFYGFTMVARWRKVPFLRKCYLILLLTDENYALEAACPIRDERLHLTYCTYLSVLNHSYWIGGLVSGALVVNLLGLVVSPETIRGYTNGMEFAMAALFLVIFTDQIRNFLSHDK